MISDNFEFSFTTPQSRSDVFHLLIDPTNWWIGLFDERIEGKSLNPGDTFTFTAGGGVHFSKQKLIEVKENESIIWEVVESRLTFLRETEEWTGTKLGFEIKSLGTLTKVTFAHLGLVPHIECFSACSNAWMQYMRNLEKSQNS